MRFSLGWQSRAPVFAAEQGTLASGLLVSASDSADRKFMKIASRPNYLAPDSLSIYVETKLTFKKEM